MRVPAVISLISLLGSFSAVREGDKPMETRSTLPRGEIRAIHHGTVSREERIPIWSYGEIYRVLGVTSARFAAWEREYGMDSMGVGADGELLIPEFPLFSKVAWTYIDAVTLTGSDISELELECARAATRTDDETIQSTFRAICDIATRARENSDDIYFGPPYSR
jgi:hypothetical protein